MPKKTKTKTKLTLKLKNLPTFHLYCSESWTEEGYDSLVEKTSCLVRLRDLSVKEESDEQLTFSKTV